MEDQLVLNNLWWDLVRVCEFELDEHVILDDVIHLPSEIKKWGIESFGIFSVTRWVDVHVNNWTVDVGPIVDLSYRSVELKTRETLVWDIDNLDIKFFVPTHDWNNHFLWNVNGHLDIIYVKSNCELICIPKFVLQVDCNIVASNISWVNLWDVNLDRVCLRIVEHEGLNVIHSHSYSLLGVGDGKGSR